MKKIYINPQWQGGADLSTYVGAEEIKEYLAGQNFVTLPVSTDEAEMAVRRNRIKGFDALRRQMHSAYDYLRSDAPDKIFTLGGGCDADVPAIVYLCEKYRGDLSVIAQRKPAVPLQQTVTAYFLRSKNCFSVVL